MTELTKALVSSLACLVASIDLADDDDIDPDIATDLLEPATDLLLGLSEADRQTVVVLLREYAEQEEEPERKAKILELPEIWGFVDEDPA